MDIFIANIYFPTLDICLYRDVCVGFFSYIFRKKSRLYFHFFQPKDNGSRECVRRELGRSNSDTTACFFFPTSPTASNHRRSNNIKMDLKINSIVLRSRFSMLPRAGANWGEENFKKYKLSVHKHRRGTERHPWTRENQWNVSHRIKWILDFSF